MTDRTLMWHRIADGELTTTPDTLNKIAKVIKRHLDRILERRNDDGIDYEESIALECAEQELTDLAEDLGLVCEPDDTGLAWRVIAEELADLD